MSQLHRGNQVEITKEIAIKVRDTVDAGLVRGKGRPIPGSMCVEAAVCFAMGLPHSDEPSCVSSDIRALKICLNDSDWSSNSARAKGMRRLALVQLGSAGAVDANDFARRIAEMTIRKIVPIALRAAAALHHAAEYKMALEASAKRCELEGTESAARSAESAAMSAESAARSAAWSAESAAMSAESAAMSARSAESAARSAESAARSAESAARSAAMSAESAAMSAESAARSAARSAESAARSAESAAMSAESAAMSAMSAARSAMSAARSAARSAESAAIDTVLSDFAENVVQVLIEMKAPGCQWLDLVPINP